MGERGQTPRKTRVRMAYAVLAVVMVLFGARFVNKMENVQALKARAADLRLGNDQLRHQNSRLSQAIQMYQRSRYIEEQARALGFVRPGEVLLLSTLRHAPMQRAHLPHPLNRSVDVDLASELPHKLVASIARLADSLPMCTYC